MPRPNEWTLILGYRVNFFTAVVVFAGENAYILISRRYAPGRESTVYRPGREPVESAA